MWKTAMCSEVFNKDLILHEDVVVNCSNEKEAYQLLEYIESLGICWYSNEPPTQNLRYVYDNTCYNARPEGLSYSSKEHYVEDGVRKVVEFRDVLLKCPKHFRRPVSSVGN